MGHDTRQPQEAVVICVDLSHSMKKEMEPSWTGSPSGEVPGGLSGNNIFNRLNEAQETFRNLVSRIGAHSLPTHMGLVTFSSKTRVTLS